LSFSFFLPPFFLAENNICVQIQYAGINMQNNIFFERFFIFFTKKTAGIFFACCQYI